MKLAIAVFAVVSAIAVAACQTIPAENVAYQRIKEQCIHDAVIPPHMPTSKAKAYVELVALPECMKASGY